MPTMGLHSHSCKIVVQVVPVAWDIVCAAYFKHFPTSLYLIVKYLRKVLLDCCFLVVIHIKDTCFDE